MSTINLETMTDKEIAQLAKLVPTIADDANAEIERRKQVQLDLSRIVKENGFTFSDGSHLSYKELLVFVQTTLGVSADNSPALVVEAVSSARAALGDYRIEGLSKWKSLAALIAESK